MTDFNLESIMKLIETPIDFDAVNLKLAHEREKSLVFLHVGLEE